MAGRAMLIRGAPGAGKSALALALMAMGAGLVADDQTWLRREGDGLVADAPASLRGLIEARHVGLLRAEAAGPVPLVQVVTLTPGPVPRLPEVGRADFLGVALPDLTLAPDPRLAPALRQLLLGGLAA